MSTQTSLSLHWVDIAIILAYLGSLIGIGIFQSRKQSDLKDFFLAGREMRWLVVGASLMAALNSGIDYLMQPSAVIKFGVFALAGNLSWLLLYPYVFFITLPLYRKLGAISAYEYLETRFDIRVRTLAASIFILWRLGWMATALYVPALALSVATGHPDKAWLITIAIGCVATIYTMLGGIRAVVWTNVTQFIIMFTGLTTSVIIILINIDGGVGAVFNNWSLIGLESPVATANESGGLIARLGGYFFIPMTFFGMLIATTMARLGTYTSDQVMVQRFQTARSLKDARKGFIITATSDTVWMLTLGFIGLALFTFYGQTMGGLPEWANDKPDQIFPFFMTQVFPVGLVGLVIAAIMAASLSSIDSAINSLTSVGMVDFYNRLFLKRKTNAENISDSENKKQIKVSRMITLAVGIIGIILSCNVDRLGSLLEIANKLINSFTGPLLGIYLLGMFDRIATAKSALVGGVVGSIVTLYTAFQEQIHNLVNLPLNAYISFLWPSLFGFIATFGIGHVVALMQGKSTHSQAPLTWSEVQKLDEDLRQ